MTWFKIDDGFHCHPKVLEAGNEGVGFYVRCGSYCAQHLTDGLVPRSIALLYGNSELCELLTSIGLWKPVQGGWQMHDYLDYNPSREQVLAERKATADRQKQFRERKARERAEAAARNAVTNAVTDAGSAPLRNGVTNGVTNGDVTAVSHRESRCESRRPDPTRPDPTRSSYGTTTPTAPRKRGTRIAEDFKPTPDMVKWAREETPDVDGRWATEKFLDYWQSKAGKDAIKIDWAKTWKNWMREEQERAARRRPSHLRAVGQNDPATTGQRRIEY